MQNRNSKVDGSTSASLVQNGLLAAYPLEVAQKIAVEICYIVRTYQIQQQRLYKIHRATI